MNLSNFSKDRSSRCKTGWSPVLFTALILTILIAQPVSGLVIIEYFHQPGCINCEQTDPVIDTIRTHYRSRVAVEDVIIDDRAGVRLLLSYGMTEIPVVVINRNKVLAFREITPGRLDEEILLAESGAYPVPGNRKSLFDGDSIPSVFFSFCLGLMTGFSPCLLGSLVVLIAASGSPAANARTGKYYPLVFGAGIIAAYVIVAMVILGAGIALRPDAGSRLAIYGTGGLIAIIVGIVQVGLVSLPNRLNHRVSALVSTFHTLPGIFLLGILFAVLFAPCAIAPFLVLIEAILIGNAIAPAAMILAFSAGLFTPFVILAVLRNSVAEKKILEYAGIIQKIGGLLLIVFGIWLILSI